MFFLFSSPEYGRDLVEDVRKDTSSDFEKILVAMLQAQREENTPVDMSRAAADAEALYNAGEKYVYCYCHSFS